MRILYVLSQYPKLSETFVLREVALMHELGHEVSVCSFRPPIPREVDLVKADNPYLAPARIAPRSLRMALGAWRHGKAPGNEPPDGDAPWRERIAERYALGALGPWIAKTARETGADWIHAHFAAVTATAAWSASVRSGIPFGFVAHAYCIFRRQNPYLRAKANAAALPATVSEHHRDYLAQRLGAAAARRFEVTRCGVDLNEFAPGAGEKTLDLAAVGRLEKKKGFDVLVRALAQLPQPRPRCQIVGEGPERSRIQAEIERLGLGASVQLRGALSHGQTRELIAGSRAFVLPCRIAADGDRDGLPVALIEALALGTPAVSTPVAGIPELIEDGVTGLLARVDDPDSLAGAIRRLLGDAELSARFASAGRRRVEDQYDLRKNVRRLASLIQHRLAGKSS